ncbi:MAG TPA: DUF4173 domain-containing protein, partial [Chthoniobacteraceae bacterium]|nr:DUF4173 domain-containing protein [Chthoniobacteraceae bacterium]
LSAWLLGEWCFAWAPAGWPRWVEAMISMLGAPVRWFRFFGDLERSGVSATVNINRRGEQLWRAAQVIVPSAVLAGIFLTLLSQGNAVLADFVVRISQWVETWIGQWDVSFGRLIFWCVVSAMALTWLAPIPGRFTRHLWCHQWPQWRRRDLSIGQWQSLAVLVALNVVFFSANSLDVFYLWADATLPKGVSLSAYLHSGVGSLILAVILSAVVLVGIYQQQEEVTGSRSIRVLSYLWIAQNILLIAGVVLRLKLYVDAYHWTELRVYVGCFLVLVAFGFGALTWKILREKSLGWLIIRNLQAVFGLFFCLQFLNVAGWIAEANVEQWRNNPARTLDIAYLEGLGAPAWPALARAMEIRPESGTQLEVRALLMRRAAKEAERLHDQDWRSLQLRRDLLAWRLIHRMPRLVP